MDDDDVEEQLELLREIATYTKFTTAWTFVTALFLVLILVGVVSIEVRPIQAGTDRSRQRGVE